MHANSSSYYCQTRVYRHTTMEEEEALSEFYRQRLYGPHRDKSQERCRSFCTKDSVKDALENGEYDTTPQNKWMPSMKEWYKGYERVNIERHKGSKSEGTNFTWGFDNTKHSTTNDDYKWSDGVEKPKRAINDSKTHIPDFCPSLSEESEKPRNSIYHSSYTIEPDIPRPRPKPHAERRKHTNDLRETHFKLGNWENSKKSETNHALSFIKSPPLQSTVTKQDTYGSKVFRDGDWNSYDRKLARKSVTKEDFLEPNRSNEGRPNTLTYEDQFTGKNYQRATHFKLGNEASTDSSVYSKDFIGNAGVKKEDIMMTKNLGSLNLFPNSQGARTLTMKEDSYQNHGEKFALSNRKERIEILDEIKQRHGLSSIHISDKLSDKSLGNHGGKYLSITSSDFPRPPAVDTESAKNIIPLYNHISGNYYGKDSKLSEARESYIPHNNTSAQLRNECYERRRDNKSTHFSFGTDPTDDNRTEKSSQYRDPVPLDPSVRAAGKGEQQKKAYSHILPQNVEDWYRTGSVMKDDYKAPKISCSNESSTEHTTRHNFDTHFFHTDLDFQGTQKTTTRTDFISPIKMLTSATNHPQLKQVYAD